MTHALREASTRRWRCLSRQTRVNVALRAPMPRACGASEAKVEKRKRGETHEISLSRGCPFISHFIAFFLPLSPYSYIYLLLDNMCACVMWLNGNSLSCASNSRRALVAFKVFCLISLEFFLFIRYKNAQSARKKDSLFLFFYQEDSAI